MRNHKLFCIAVFSLTLAGLLSVAALGQGASATISGTVQDETGGVLPGVEIAVTHIDRGITRTTVSDDEGRYSAPELPLGNYEVAGSLTGFQTAVRAGIALTVGRHAVVNLVLSIGEISERVVVTGEAPTVETTSSTISGLVDERQMRDLPLNGRSFSDLVLLQMGVSKLTLGSSGSSSGFGPKISISGARPSSNSFLLDGNFVNDTLNNTPGGATGFFLGVETLKEFTVLTNTYSAEFGQSAGGIINAVTKSGTNELHGSVFYFHRNDNLDARKFFETDPSNPTERSDPPEFRRHQFGFTAGGPIVPNKTFIFGGYEGLRQALGRTLITGTLTDEARAGQLPDPDNPGEVIAVAPGVAEYFIFLPPQNSRTRDEAAGIGEAILGRTRISEEDNFVVKVDHSFSDSDTMFGRYTFDDAAVDNPGINFSSRFVTRNQYLTLEEKHIFSPQLLNVARVGYNRNALLERDFQLFPFDESLQLVPTNRSALPDLQEGLLGTFVVTGLGSLGGSSITPRIYRTNLFEYADTVTYVRGRHSLKFGANIKRVQANMVSPQRTFGSLLVDSPIDFLQGQAASFSFITEGSDVNRGIRFTVMGFFIQDDFQIRPNVTLNLGLRYEPSTGHSEVNGKLANMLNIRTDSETTVVEHMFENPTKKNFAPRLGLAWDPFGDGKTAVRAGFGIFYNIQMAEIDRISATSNPPFATIGSVTGGLPFPVDFEACCVGAAGASTPSLELIDFNAPQPYRMQWNLNVQRELVQNTSLTIGYVGARGVDLLRVYQWNQPDPVSPSQCGPTDGPTCVNPDPSRSPFYYPLPGDRPPSSAPFGNAPCFFFTCQRVNPNFASSIQRSGGADSYYHSLQLSLNKRFSNRFHVQGSYTWSKSLDTSSKQIRGPGESAQTASLMNLLDTAGDKGFSNFDVINNFTLNYTVELPGQSLAGVGGKVLGGWQLGGIVTLASGVPQNIELGYDVCRCLNGEFLGVFGTDTRPDLASGGDNNPVLGDGREPLKYFDSSDSNFVVGPSGFHGDLGRNTLRIPGVAQWDFSLIKNTSLGEEAEVQFRAEFFNIFNRANFGSPSTSLFFGPGRPNAGAGRITSLTTTSREIQLGLKIIF